MSVIQEIVEDINRFLVKSNTYFSDKKFYFDLSQVSANTELPCFCWNSTKTEENQADKGLNPECRSLKKEIQFMALTNTTDTSQLIKELWDFEEKTILAFRDEFPQNINENLMNIDYTGSSSIDSLFTKTEDKTEGKFFANLLYCTYNLEYMI